MLTPYWSGKIIEKTGGFESYQKFSWNWPLTRRLKILFRRHGVYVWGPTWELTKTMCECYDYLFEIAVKMRQMGMDPNQVPQNSPYKDVMDK